MMQLLARAASWVWAAQSTQLLTFALVTVLNGAFEQATIEFINENGGGPGVRLKKRQQKKAQRTD